MREYECLGLFSVCRKCASLGKIRHNPQPHYYHRADFLHKNVSSRTMK